MRATILAISGLCLTLSHIGGVAYADEADPSPALSVLSGPVSERSQTRLQGGERVRVIVMMHDQNQQRAMRSLPDVRGSAARAQFGGRRASILREALGIGLYRPDATLEDAAEVYADFPISGGFALTANALEINALSAHPDVAAVFEDVPAAPSHLAWRQASAQAPTQPVSLAVMDVQTVWNAGFTGQGQTLAILDSGIALNHVAFEGAIIAGACFSSTETGQSQSLCEGGAQQVTSLSSGAPAEDCVTLDVDPEAGLYGCGHGTHVAALAAGRPVAFYNHVFSGVAPDADLVPINVFSRFEGEDCTRQGGAGCILSWTTDQIAALEWLYQNNSELGVDLINMSFGGEEHFEPCLDAPLRPIIQLLAAEGVGVLASSGNEGYRNALSAPACIPEVISVANSAIVSGSANEQILYSSNKAPFLDMAASGVNLMSAFDVAPVTAEGRCLNKNSDGNWFGGPILEGECHYFRYLTGTSMASPTAAGAFALLRQSSPETSMAELLAAVQLTGNPASDLGIGRGFASVNAGQAFEYLRSNRTILPGVSIEPEVAYRATNSTVNISSYSDSVYRLTNSRNTPVSISVIEAPGWLEVSSDSLTIAPGATSELRLGFRKRLHLLPDVLVSPDSPFPRITMGALVLGAGAERFELPVSLSAFGVIEADGQYGPFPAFAETGAGPTSIFRISGLYSGPPESLSIVFKDESGDEAENFYRECSLPVRNERFSGTEYLLLNRDMADCAGVENAQAYLYLTPRSASDYEHIKVRRFVLGGNGSLTDFSADPNQNISTALVDYWPQSHNARALDSDLTPEEAAGLMRTQSDQSEALVPGTQQLLYTSTTWVGDHADLMRSSFVIERLNGARLSHIVLYISYPTGDVSQLTPTDYSEISYTCTIHALDARRSWDSYLVLPEDYAVCGDFGRSDMDLSIFIEAGTGTSPLAHVSRYVYGAEGSVTDITWDRRDFFDAPRANDAGDASVTVHKSFEWVGDAQSPTQNLIRFAPIVGQMRSIDVAINNAASGSYANDFDDCTIEIDPARSGLGDYVLTSSDLAVCGDYVRADLRFRLNGPEEAFGRIVTANRIGLGANGDITNFSFDEEVDKGIAPSRVGSVDRVDFGPFEWVGDADAGTQGVFRITGLGGELPTRIQIRIANEASSTQPYSDAFSDCELTVKPERSIGGEYLILPADLSECGAFGRADLHFRLEAAAGTMSQTMLMRRFAVTLAGGLTDFTFDNEVIVRVIGFN
ncbi:S8 family serine peptidase [Oceanicaulis sp. LC35]|uniref:S8 family peptidase n=1 Tax=Oceanicaulis sp. LC35 TaxID=3349635 RepID=UPI003F82C836